MADFRLEELPPLSPVRYADEGGYGEASKASEEQETCPFCRPEFTDPASKEVLYRTGLWAARLCNPSTKDRLVLSPVLHLLFVKARHYGGPEEDDWTEDARDCALLERWAVKEYGLEALKGWGVCRRQGWRAGRTIDHPHQHLIVPRITVVKSVEGILCKAPVPIDFPIG